MDAVCSVVDCGGATRTKGMCQKHYLRMWRHGTLEISRASPGDLLNYILTVAVPHKGKKACLTWPYGTDSLGYGQIQYKGEMKRPHRIVCRKVHGKPPTKKHMACHSCGKGNEGCINPNHLYWGTGSQNQLDRRKHGTDSRGERSASSRLTSADVLEIKQFIAKGYTQARVARRFKVQRQTISDIHTGRRWKHITEIKQAAAKRGFRCT